MRRSVVMVGIVVALGVLAVVEQDVIAQPTTCGSGSWTAGSVDLCDGELVYRDYVYDDHGSSLFGMPDDRAEGIYAALRIPTDAYGDLHPAGIVHLAGVTGERDNTADLVALRVRVDETSMHVQAELNTMFEPDDAMVIVGIDTDNDPSTSSSPTWPEGIVSNPFELFVVNQPLANVGLDAFVVLTDGDPETNLFAAAVPRPAGTRWRLQAVVAQDVPHVLTGPVVMNVAFRGLDERGHWWENAQAKALALNDIRSLAHIVEVADLVDGVTRRQQVPAGLVRQRVHISQYPVGEGLRPPDGVAAKAAQAFGNIDFLGRYQPYGIVVPDTPGPHGIQFVLHGLGENHSALLADPATAQNPPPIATQMGIAHDRITVVPFGRGPSGFYAGAAHRDFLDVLADVVATHRVDEGRIVSGGMSMGGYGALRMASLHPDVFAAAVTWVAFTGDVANGTPLAGAFELTEIGGLGNMVDLLGNLRHVPLGALYSGEDELVHVNEAIAIRDRLAELELESAHWLHHPAVHSSFATTQDYAKEADWAQGRTRVQDPARVSFRTDERFFDEAMDLAPDGAYWIDDIVPAGVGYANVEATTFGCGTWDVQMGQADAVGSGPGPWVWTGQFIEPVGQDVRESGNRIDLVLSNVSSLTIEVGDPEGAPGDRGACLTWAAVTCQIVTDGPTTITFTDGRVIDVPAGAHDCTVAAVAEDGAVATPGNEPAGLPATGGGVVAGLALVLASAACRRVARCA